MEDTSWAKNSPRSPYENMGFFQGIDQFIGGKEYARRIQRNRNKDKYGHLPTDLKRTEAPYYGSLRDFGPEYKEKEAALFAAANGQEPATDPDPTPEPPITPLDAGNGRDTAPPSDPNNTGAKGTQMGLSGGSLSQGFDSAGFTAMLGRSGISMMNPFGSQPNPATPAGNSQQRLNPGEISLNSGQQTGESLPVDGQIDNNNALAHSLETDRTLSPDDTTVDAEKPTNWAVDQRTDERMAARAAFLDPNNKGYNAIRARDAAMGLGRQGDQFVAMGSDGELQEITREGYDQRVSGNISAQTLLDEHLKFVPDKAIDKAIVAGDAEVITEPSSSLTSYGEVSYDTSNPFPITESDDMTFDFSATRKNIRDKK